MIATLVEIWKSRDLRFKVLYTAAILLFVRVIAHIPLPAFDRFELEQFLSRAENQVFGVLSIFTGGSLANLSIALLGVGPYITASIVVQILTKAIPSWEEISKEGTSGREKLNQYSRYLTFPLALIQGYGTMAILRDQNVLTNISNYQLLIILLTISAASIFMMWLGELISEKGIGNGISLIIVLSIVAGMPQQISNTASAIEAGSFSSFILFGLVALITVVVIVVVNDAERKIPITYPRRVISPTTTNPIGSYLPIRVNIAGVIPIIFALSFLTFPTIVARFLSSAKSQAVASFARAVTDFTSNDLYYGLTYFVLVIAFTFFYVSIIFQPAQISENLQKQGGFIPGIRPGKETTEFIRQTISRLTVVGAFFIAAIAVLPLVMQGFVSIPTLVIGGTSVLIVVSVVIETAKQLAGQLSMRRYDTI